MGSTSEHQVLLFDYQFAPNAQKARNLLNACGIPYKVVPQPFVLPRPFLNDLGVTYRRIPVNAIGKDLYCDNRAFLEAVQTIFKDRALPTSAADHAYEAFGYRSFWISLALLPASMLSKELSDDRKDLYSVFNRPDFATLRPSALGEFKQLLDIVENEFLSPGPWIGGSKCSVADIHAGWMIKWDFQTIGVSKDPGFSKDDWPKVYKWIESLPEHKEQNEAEKISEEDAKKQILSSGYAAKEIGIDSNDPTGLKAGSIVAVMTNDDATPNNNPQHGKLVGLGNREIVIELENSLRVHFPRIGYIVKQA